MTTGVEKRIAAFLIGLFCAQAGAAEFPFMISCVTSPKASKTVVLKREGNKVNFHYRNAESDKFTQIHFGSVFAGQMAQLDLARGLLTQIGREIKVQFDANRCRYGGQTIFRCENYKAPPVKLNGHQVLVGAVFSEALLSHSLNGQFVTHTIYLNLSIDGTWVAMPISYEDGNCQSMNTDAHLQKESLPPEKQKQERWQGEKEII